MIYKYKYWINNKQYFTTDSYKIPYSKLHRIGKPSLITYEKDIILNEQYFINGKRHRNNKPAYITYRPCGKIHYEYYFKSDLPHRENGPSYFHYDKDGNILDNAYYLVCERYNEEQFNFIIKQNKQNIHLANWSINFQLIWKLKLS